MANPRATEAISDLVWCAQQAEKHALNRWDKDTRDLAFWLDAAQKKLTWAITCEKENR